MSNKDLARRTIIRVHIDGVDVSDDINKYLISLDYTDNEADETDDLQIKLDDREGIWLNNWLSNAIEAAASGFQALPEDNQTDYSVIAQSGLNVRSGRGKEHSIIGSLTYGAHVQVIAIENGWAEISYNGRTAFISEAYIQKNASPEPSRENSGTVKGLRIGAVIIRKNWHGDGYDEVLETGEFELDAVDVSGFPSTITIKGTSLSYKSSIRQTKKSKAWESVTLSTIAKEKAAVNGMACIYESAYDPVYQRVEQVNRSDIDFLSELCQRAGISLKATSNIIVLFDQVQYEAVAAVHSITKGEKGQYIKYKFRTGNADTSYDACHVSYIDPISGELYEYTYSANEDEREKEDIQVLEIRQKVSSVDEARMLAMKMLRLHNKYENTAEFTLPGDTSIVAGITIELVAWGVFSGKYIVTRAKHTVSGSGYSVAVSMRRVLEGY